MRFVAFLLLTAFLSGCAIPASDPVSAQGKRAILDNVNMALTRGDCSTALTEISPLYNSSNTDNEVRLTMASVYGCSAGFNMFTFFNNMSNLSTNFGVFGPFAEFVAQEFPSSGNLSSPSDKVVEAAGLGLDALMAVLNSGEVLVPSDLFNTTTDNPGSLLASDRTADANFYMIFLSMVAMGGLENRAGANANGTPQNNPPFPATETQASTIDSNGCAYASALINFSDAIGAVASSLSGQLGTKISQAAGALPTLVYTACQQACLGVINVGCSVPAAQCSATCPRALRNRASCLGSNADQNSCAAAGIMFLVNSVGGWT